MCRIMWNAWRRIEGAKYFVSELVEGLLSVENVGRTPAWVDIMSHTFEMAIGPIILKEKMNFD